ncbi:hypothetical protein DI392_11470 [Vibrio albus]|uniref:Probable membrane transporter protein n=1 Tax=Vibrio albus TaxID=2200953 RepID=A0A2U3B9R1_9VIBR|nr:sulfite exporter TauE/SafE family protein [Vibrio albus]PWI33454.1 hypothetical protein DI392_11470 [Vibrio albus]
MDYLIQEIFVSFSFYEICIRLIFGCLIGLCLGMTGVGGGVFIIPVLQVAFGMNPVLAVGTASVISALVKVNAAVSHIMARNVSWKEVAYILVGAVPISIIVANFIVHLARHPEYSGMITETVQRLILTIMLFSLVTMLVKLKREWAGIPHKTGNDSKKMVGIGSGAACGAIMASTGVGGGVLILPTLNSILGLDIKRSVGSSIVIALVLSGISAIQYSSGGQSDLATALILTAGAFTGVPVAVRAVNKLSSVSMYIITIAVIFISLMLTLFGL